MSIAFMQVASQIALHVNGMRKCVLGRNNTKKDLRMHALVDKIASITYMLCNFESKKTITIKSRIQIKFRLHHYLSYDKIFKTRPHFSMLA